MSTDWSKASRVVLALGSNLGDRLAALQGALDALADPDALRLLAVSPVYETAPVAARNRTTTSTR